jgi:phosphoglucomutase
MSGRKPATIREGGCRPAADTVMDVDPLLDTYYEENPDPTDSDQAVSLETSGHRGGSLPGTLTQDVYKLSVEGLRGEQHLEQILDGAQQVVDAALER